MSAREIALVRAAIKVRESGTQTFDEHSRILISGDAYAALMAALDRVTA